MTRRRQRRERILANAFRRNYHGSVWEDWYAGLRVKAPLRGRAQRQLVKDMRLVERLYWAPSKDLWWFLDDGIWRSTPDGTLERVDPVELHITTPHYCAVMTGIE